MCQLLGMNCAAPTDFSFSLRGFCKRGGETDVHSHGFGVCVYKGRGLQCFHDTEPACSSPIARLVQQYPVRTLNMMAHIRYATHGDVSLENVHPFARVWKGIQLCFAHNGDCPRFKHPDAGVPGAPSRPILLGRTRPDDIHYHPVGDTDSEAVFCAILNALAAEFPGDRLPTLPVLHEFLSALCREIVRDCPDETIFNFLLGCGQYTMFAFSWPGRRRGSAVWNGLHYLIREPPFGAARLIDDDLAIDFAEVTTATDRVAVIATKPLTGETGWREMARGELLMFDKGKAYRTPECCAVVEREGRGLSCRWFAQKCHEWRRERSGGGMDGGGNDVVASSVHAETILTSPSLTGAASCDPEGDAAAATATTTAPCSEASDDDSDSDEAGAPLNDVKAPVPASSISPTTVAISPPEEKDLAVRQHLLRLDSG